MVRYDVIPFHDLGVDTRHDVLSLRQLVICIEQKCVYLDCDGKDRASLHLLGRDDDDRLLAYTRLLPPGLSYPEASIGRVVTHPTARRLGLGRSLTAEAIARAREAFGPGPIRIGAQLYLRRFYEDFGFEVAGSPYEEDGILHVEMIAR